MIKRNLTYIEAVDLFIGANVEWLSETEQPIVTALYKAAEQLDKRTTATLLSEYRQLFRELMRQKPGSLVSEQVDKFDEMMADFK